MAGGDPNSASTQQQMQTSMMAGLQLTQSGQEETPCLQLTYHRAVKNRLLLVYPKELVILDVVSMQSVAQVVLDKSASSFVHVFPCSQRDAVYFFQVKTVGHVWGKLALPKMESIQMFGY